MKTKMNYPSFFNQVEKIVLQDPISDFLGVFEDGIVEFSYLDVVKTAGHSCPTVAGAYLVCLRALQHLYPQSIPKRGDIQIEIKNQFTEGVTGVIATVFSQISGATEIAGFKGIAGQFVRHSLMSFEAEINGQYRFTRKDSGAAVLVNYQTTAPIDPRQHGLLQKALMGMASKEERTLLGHVWQERVKTILVDLVDEPEIIIL